MTRVVLLALAIWAFLLMPQLCAAGLLLHGCDDCPVADEPCGSKCDASDDPCDMVVVAKSEQPVTRIELAAIDLGSGINLDSESDASEFRIVSATFPAARKLPFAESDIPLRI